MRKILKTKQSIYRWVAMFAPLTKTPVNLLVLCPSHVLGLLTYWLVPVDCKTLENAKPSQYLRRGGGEEGRKKTFYLKHRPLPVLLLIKFLYKNSIFNKTVGGQNATPFSPPQVIQSHPCVRWLMFHTASNTVAWWIYHHNSLSLDPLTLTGQTETKYLLARTQDFSS